MLQATAKVRIAPSATRNMLTPIPCHLLAPPADSQMPAGMPTKAPTVPAVHARSPNGMAPASLVRRVHWAMCRAAIEVSIARWPVPGGHLPGGDWWRGRHVCGWRVRGWRVRGWCGRGEDDGASQRLPLRVNAPGMPPGGPVCRQCKAGVADAPASKMDPLATATIWPCWLTCTTAPLATTCCAAWPVWALEMDCALNTTVHCGTGAPVVLVMVGIASNWPFDAGSSRT